MFDHEGAFEDLNNAGLLAIGLQPEWVDQTDYDGPPSSASDGVYLQATAKAIGYVALREVVAWRTSRVAIGVVDLTTTVYTVTVDGNAVVYDASVALPADTDALVQGIVDAINADVTVSPIVTASVDEDDVDGKTILIRGDTEDDYSIDASAAGGTGTIASIVADAVSCDVRLFVTPGGIIKDGSDGNPDGWVMPVNGFWSPVDYRGFMERFDVAGNERAYLQLTDIATDAGDGVTVEATVQRVMIGPAVNEATS